MINTFGQPSMNGHFGGFATPGGGTGMPLQGSPAPMPPTQVGMVPGVPGSMGLNPSAGQPPAQGFGPVPGTGLAPGSMPMTPGGGGTGAPLQAPDPRSGIVQSIMSRFGGPAFGGNPGGNFNISGFRDAMDQYRDSRPLIAPGTTADARQTQLQDWRATRPSPKSYF